MSRKLIEKVPKYYQNSRVMACLFGTDEAALDAAQEMLDETDAQCLVSSADVMLSRWERIFGVPTSQESYERRRERLLARKRGGGTGTVEHLKRVISSFSNGEVEVTEYYGEYLIHITFVGEYGVPPYLDDVKAAIDDIIPAHIAYTVVIVYRTWSDIAGYTWSELAGKTWEQISEGEI